MRNSRAASGLMAAALVAVVVQAPMPPQPDARAAEPGAVAPASQPPASAGTPLPVLDGGSTPSVDAAVLAAGLGPLLADPALGPEPGAVVLDGADGTTLLDLRADAPLAPASSLKVATGLAALAALGPQTRLATRVVRDADGGLVLIGGGDPTLVTLPPTSATGYPAPASLAELADATAAALKASAVPQVALRYDAGLFTGPSLSPDWDPDFVGLGIVSPVSALTVDPDSQQIDGRALDSDPAGAAAAWFAARLQTAGLAVTSVTPGTAGPEADDVASVRSPPIGALVDRMLDLSDNDVAEALFRLAALGMDLPASFEGGVQAVTSTLTTLQVPMPGLVVRDGSGLSRSNRIAPATLAAALQITADPGSPALSQEPGERGLEGITWLPAGLSVGGLTGSLADRFDTADTSTGAGRVQAKTGTLTGVTSLSGVVTSGQGRPLVFAVLGNGTPDTVQARAALDRIAAALAGCGCQAAAP